LEGNLISPSRLIRIAILNSRLDLIVGK